MGTCEDMYYLRYDQRHTVQHEDGNLDVLDNEVLREIRFRFPWPDEDGLAPGDYEDSFRNVALYGVKVPAGVKHYTVQFKADCGYLMFIPCPEGHGVPDGLKLHKNGWRGDVLLVQQAVRDGHLVPIFECGGCGSKFCVE